MLARARRSVVLFVAFSIFLTAWYHITRLYPISHPSLSSEASDQLARPTGQSDPADAPVSQASPTIRPASWSGVKEFYPISSYQPMPTGTAAAIPTIQFDFQSVRENASARATRLMRLQAVKENFEHAWAGYKEHAWLQDELSPISGGSKERFGGWAATLVDAMDTLWIMGLKSDFDTAVSEVAKIDFMNSTLSSISVFETNIRYLGGFLAAYDLSGNHQLLAKATELGDMLYHAFDTPSRMPITRWDWSAALKSKSQGSPVTASLSETGSLSLEFTRLSQLTGDGKYFDATQRLTTLFEKQQNQSTLPGMWPLTIDFETGKYGGTTFGFGAMSDSMYEYLPKQHLLLGGASNQTRLMYEYAIDTAKRHNFFRPLNEENLDILLSADVTNYDKEVKSDHLVQHLVCFVGGMLALGSKLFNRTEDLPIARKLTDGCAWAYNVMPSGIMPETFYAVPCEKADDCLYTTEKWHEGIQHQLHRPAGDIQAAIDSRRLVPGFADHHDTRYLLRPEAIESIFILYRITGDPSLQDQAWRMFEAIANRTRTEYGHAALADVTLPVTATAAPLKKLDDMESFWLAETLKYFYLVFADPNLISLDEYVL